MLFSDSLEITGSLNDLVVETGVEPPGVDEDDPNQSDRLLYNHNQSLILLSLFYRIVSISSSGQGKITLHTIKKAKYMLII